MLIDYNSDGITDEVITIHDAVQTPPKIALINRTVLTQEPTPLWFNDCPLMISRQEIISLENANIYLEITIQNLHSNTIKAIFMDIQCFDYLQKPLPDITDFKLIDLSIEGNQRFSTNMNIALPDANTRKYKVIVKNIVFDNNIIWTNETATQFELIPAPAKIQFKPEIIRFMSGKLKGRPIPYNQYLFQSISTDEYWFCGCGQFNTSQDNNCRNCHISKNEVLDIINEEALQQEYNQMMQEKLQHSIENKEQRQRKLLEHKEQISNQIGQGKEKIKNLLNKK